MFFHQSSFILILDMNNRVTYWIVSASHPHSVYMHRYIDLLQCDQLISYLC